MNHSSPSTHSRFLYLCDTIIVSGIRLLLFLTPLCFGTVHLWSYTAMESGIFGLVAIWMVKLIIVYRKGQLSESRETATALPVPCMLVVPLLLFVVVSGLQLVPLPPILLSYLSPSTYAVYQQSLPGWPERSPYEKWLRKENEMTAIHNTGNGKQNRDSENEVRWTLAADSQPLVVLGPGVCPKCDRYGIRWIFIAAPQASSASDADACPNCSHLIGEWMPLSFAPAQTQLALVKLLAYISFFFLILLYPIGTKEEKDIERQFLRPLLMTVLGAGFLIAAIGIVQRYHWNGKILWFFVPEQWRGAQINIVPRASGPYVNSDHFANYLMLSIPLLLAGLLSTSLFVSHKKRKSFRIFCSGGLFVALIGLLLSLSRGGWLGAMIGVGIFSWLLMATPPERRPRILSRMNSVHLRSIVISSVVVGGIALVCLGFSVGRQITQRVDETFAAYTGEDARVKVWQGSIGMVRDFPLLGVGLGAWSELFPRYQEPPWSPLRWQETHNDYLQCLAETGVVGLGFLLWFLGVAISQLRKGLSRVRASHIPVVIGILAALGGMAAHEGFDFSLQIPANALLFSALLALGLRISGQLTYEAQTVSPLSWQYSIVGSVDEPHAQGRKFTLYTFWREAVAVCISLIAFTMSVLSLTQQEVPFHSDPDEFVSVADARTHLLAFPARSEGHLALFALQDGLIPASERDKELEIALWLTPLKPDLRDQYVVTLLDEGRQDEALREVRQSLFYSPKLDTHFYLEPEAIPMLDPPEVRAIEEGLQNALNAGYPGALAGLGEFYGRTDRPLAKAQLYENAALNEPSENRQTHYLLEAGEAYAQAGEKGKAEARLRQVIELTPRDPRAYLMLISDVFAIDGDTESARMLADEGIKHGADPSLLLLTAARMVLATGKTEEAHTILHDLLQRKPYSFDGQYQLGVVYLRERNYPRAALTLKEAVRLRPTSAEALFMLGQAEESQYHYSEADRAYTRAIQFAPENDGIRERYENFLKKLQANHDTPREDVTASVNVAESSSSFP